MSAALWSDWHVTEEMIDQRLFPRIYALSEQMWHKGDLIPFEKFYEKMQSKYPLLNAMEINYGPALKTETPKDYKWD
jgi:N-acetyl-beta-hexosaminidase